MRGRTGEGGQRTAPGECYALSRACVRANVRREQAEAVEEVEVERRRKDPPYSERGWPCAARAIIAA